MPECIAAILRAILPSEMADIFAVLFADTLNWRAAVAVDDRHHGRARQCDRSVLANVTPDQIRRSGDERNAAPAGSG
jgi:hypothetical protein